MLIKKINKQFKLIIRVFIILSLFFITSSSFIFATTIPIDLRSAGNFGTLAGGAITGTGSVEGDMGSSSGAIAPAITTTGTKYTTGHPVVVSAVANYTTAYNDGLNRTYDTQLSASTYELGGDTLTDGIYSIGTSATLTTQLTLDGQGDANSTFIIQIGTTLSTTATYGNVVLVGGAKAGNVYWVVQGAITAGATTNLVGTFLGGSTFTFGATTTLDGRVLVAKPTGTITLATTTISEVVPVVFSNPTPLNLGSAGDFGTLSGGAISGTGSVQGDMGSGTGSIAAAISTTGTKYPTGDSIVLTAISDYDTAYNEGLNRTYNLQLSGSTYELGGKTLTRGIYNIGTTAAITTPVTFDAEGDPNAVFIIQIGATLGSTAGAGDMILSNGAQAKNVFWVVQAAITIGANTDSVGIILGGATLTFGATTTLDGRVLVGKTAGTITLATTTITNVISPTISLISISNNNTPTPTIVFTVNSSATDVNASTITFSDTINPTFVDGDGYLNCVSDVLNELCTLTYGNLVNLPSGNYNFSIEGLDADGNSANTYLGGFSIIFSTPIQVIDVNILEKVTSSNYFDYNSNSKPYHLNSIESYNSENLFLYYPFNYNNISNSDDYSSNNYNFSKQGGIIWNLAGCHDNSGCYTFDGINDYLDLEDLNIDFSKGFSISTWIRFDSLNNWSKIMDLGNGPNNNNILIGNSGITNDLTISIYNGTIPGTNNIPGLISTGEFFHLAVTFDSLGNYQVYKNSELIQSGSTNSPNSVLRTNNYIGKSNWISDSYFDGIIDEFRMYNTSLNINEIENIFSNSENIYSGQITISNTHTTEPVYDVEIILNNSDYVSTPYNSLGNIGYIVNSTQTRYTLFIPELAAGETSIFNYDIYPVKKFPILLNSTSSSTRFINVTSFSISDTVVNVFENDLGQTNCINNVSLFNSGIDLSNDSTDKVKFSSFVGSGSSYVNLSVNSTSFDWNINNSNCFNIGDSFEITYDIDVPIRYVYSGFKNISNTNLTFKLQDTFSGINIEEILGISNANMSLEKNIINFSNSVFRDSNVTWNVNSSFYTSSLLYELTKATMWVSQRNISGVYADPNTIENDSISNSQLIKSYDLNSMVNFTNPWFSTNWYFNFSGFDTPIVWFSVDFTIFDDGIQLSKSKTSESHLSTYTRGVSFISGYWLDINKNVTSISNSTYNVNIVVSNKGSLVTPGNAIVTIYDLIPENFALTGPISKSASGWYSTSEASNTINGELGGDLYQWALIPTNLKNSSLDFGLVPNSSNSVTISYNITGTGDYNYLDVFITGLDPQKVEGAGSTKIVQVTEKISESGNNFWFGLSSIILLGLIFIV